MFSKSSLFKIKYSINIETQYLKNIQLYSKPHFHIFTRKKGPLPLLPESPPTLPQDVLPHIFRALRLNVSKQRGVINMITQDVTTIEEVKKYVTDRQLFFSMWKRTFRSAEMDYKASLNQKDNQSGRTQAGAALGAAGGGSDKKLRSQGRNKKKLGGREEGNQSSDKSFGGASLGGKPETKVANTQNKGEGEIGEEEAADHKKYISWRSLPGNENEDGKGYSIRTSP